MSAPDSIRTPRASALRAAVAVALLAGVIFAVHGQALGLGLFMDDHAHFRQLQECDWSLSGLTAACRLELIGGTIDLWWLPNCTLRFFRPVAFGLMKLTYTLTGWSPAALHAASLLWHLLACTLLMVLLRRCGLAAWLAWAMAALFAIHPAHVATVQWIACQTELMVAALLLGATLCFARFRGWPGFAPDADTGPASRLGWAAGSIVLFGLALGCRENAVMFPLVMAVVEPWVWRRRTRAVLVVYATLGALLVGYLAVRAFALGGAALPPRPYVFPLGDPDFPRYVFDKAWYYLLGQFLLIPCVPIAGLPYLREHAVAFYGLAAGVGLLVIGVCVRYFRRPPGLVGPAWLIGFMVPSLPVFASPHHLYLPGVGWAVTLGLALHWLGTRGPAAGRWSGRLRLAATWLLLAVMGAVFARGATWVGLTFKTGCQIEECLVEEIAAAPSGLKDGDTLYVANLPLVGHYARLAVEERTGLCDLHLVPLTWAPRILGPVTPAELTWIDDRTIEVRVADDRYFSGALGRVVQEVTGGDVPDEADRSADLGFCVVVLQRDADGIIALRFTFERPLSDAGLHLFWGSRARWAFEVRREDR